MPKGKRGGQGSASNQNQQNSQSNKTKFTDEKIRKAVEGANPTHDDDNCQRCVVAVAERLKGNKVVALEKKAGDTIIRDWRNYYLNQKWDKIKPNTKSRRLDDKRADIKDQIIKIAESWNDGGIGVVYVQWYGRRSAHVFNVINDNGNIKFIDGQIGSKNYEYSFNLIKPDYVEISRVDNLKFNKKYKGTVIENEKKKGKTK